MRIEWPKNLNSISSYSVSLTELWFLRNHLLSVENKKTLLINSRFGVIDIIVNTSNDRYLISVNAMSPYNIFSIEKDNT